MKKGIIWIALTCLIVMSVILASCSSSTTSGSTTTTPTSSTTAPALTTVSTGTSVTTTGITTTTSTTGHWWDSLGTPQYGGGIVLRINSDIVNFDPYLKGGMSASSAWYERVHGDDWILDPAIFNYPITFRPSDYVKGLLAESWEFTDPLTYVEHIRKGVTWQNIPPANGRELTAYDIAAHYNRLFGLGGGYTTGSSYVTQTPYANLVSLTTPDKYTVIFKWKNVCPEFITETLQAGGGDQLIECPDAVKQWGDLSDWHHAIGTGPFILADIVSGSSASLIRNPTYWGFDERYPQNRLPYIDTIKILIIPTDATAEAALRSGKIDVMDTIPFSDSQSISKTNPELLKFILPYTAANTIEMRCDLAPFKDIKVRQALQMAIDIPTMAATYYGGYVKPYPATLTSYYESGWGFPYEQWPQSLKDEYAFNPATAKQLLAAAGYPNGFNTNIVVNSSGDKDLWLLVQSYFSVIGVNMSIRLMDAASWSTYVRTNISYDAMSANSTGNFGLTYEPLRQMSPIQSTTSTTLNYRGITDTVYDAIYPKALLTTSIAEVKQLLKDANQRLLQQHYEISMIQPVNYTICQPWLKGFNNQAKAITGSGSGPSYLGFYCGRYWIDQNTKKSFGH